jgi:hypothetical protein
MSVAVLRCKDGGARLATGLSTMVDTDPITIVFGVEVFEETEGDNDNNDGVSAAIGANDGDHVGFVDDDDDSEGLHSNLCVGQCFC